MTYGLPYKGSKTKLAERIIDLMPRAEHLYDLFAGGCAVAHCALIKGKYSHIHVNDINPMMPQAFVKALQGGFDDEDRWISREDFFRLKDTDPYAALCFSFGSDMRTYIYGKDKEEYKKALHYAIYFNSFDLSDKLVGVDLRPIQSCCTRQERYLMTKRLIKDAGITPPSTRKPREAQKSAGCKTASDTDGFRLKKKEPTCRTSNGTSEYHRLENLERNERLTPPPFSRIELESNEKTMRLKGVSGDESNLTWSATDYQDVIIKENSVIYCDIPYKGTNKYAGKGRDFDHDRFYEWALRQTQPIFISSYDMPKEDFKVIAEFKRTDTLSATNNSLRVTERIFIPRTQEYVKDNGLFGLIMI